MHWVRVPRVSPVFWSTVLKHQCFLLRTEAVGFQNKMFVLNIVTTDKEVLLKVGDITQVNPLPKIYMLQFSIFCFKLSS
jgi:hypothetical protein